MGSRQQYKRTFVRLGITLYGEHFFLRMFTTFITITAQNVTTSTDRVSGFIKFYRFKC
jgi:hypothetical protein